MNKKIVLLVPNGNDIPCLNTQLSQHTGKDNRYWHENFTVHFGQYYYCSAKRWLTYENGAHCDICNQPIKNICEWRLRDSWQCTINIDGQAYDVELPVALKSGNICVNKIAMSKTDGISKITYDADGKIVAIYGTKVEYYAIPEDISPDALRNSYTMLKTVSQTWKCPDDKKCASLLMNMGRVKVCYFETKNLYKQYKRSKTAAIWLRKYRFYNTHKNPADTGPADFLRIHVIPEEMTENTMGCQK